MLARMLFRKSKEDIEKGNKEKARRKERKRGRKLSLDEKIAKARALGISYGKYVALKHAKTKGVKEKL